MVNKIRTSSTQTTRSLTVFFDGSCPICSKEINFYKMRAGADELSWVDVSDEIRAQRVVDREGGTVSQALEANAKRSSVDAARFSELYNIQPQDPEAYTHVLDAGEMSIDEVLSAVSSILEDFK